MTIVLLTCAALAPLAARAAQLSNDAKSAIPKDVVQLMVVDYRAMQNSPVAMSLKDKTLPPELKRLETALKTSGLKVDNDVDILALAAYRLPDPKTPGTRTVGIAQGQFHTAAIQAYWTKEKTKPLMLRNNSIYPLGSAGASVAFLNQTTMIFGERDAVENALDARDGIIPNFLSNGDMVSEMASVDQRPMWSLLDQQGTQTMMKGVLGEAASLADYDTVRNRMKSSHYTMDFANGVKFDMAVVMSDTVTAAMAANVMRTVAILKKQGSSPLEKTALDDTRIDSSAGTLSVEYSASDSQFSQLLSSSLFQTVVMK